MASFRALNVDSDEEREEEPDNTKEIQIEEALRFYQNAVKYQAQGLSALKETDAAYKQLFESEIFQYPESLSELRREELYGDWISDVGQSTGDAENGADGTEVVASSALPQVIHLSYKNRGQFHIDVIRQAIKSGELLHQDLERLIKGQALRALDDLANATDKDEDDVDVWRRAARVGRLLGSRRVARFCLEAVVDGDELGTDDLLNDAGVDIKLADHDLQDLKLELNDPDSRTPLVPRSKSLPESWRKQLALYQDVEDTAPSQAAVEPEELIVSFERSWSSLGQALLNLLQPHHDGHALPKAAAHVRLAPQEDVSVPEAKIINGDTTPAPRTRSKSISPEVVRRRASMMPARRETFSSLDIEKVVSPPPELSQPSDVIILPSRKRNSEAAELQEARENGRVRSKRLRARESLVMDIREAEVSFTEAPAYEQRIKDCAQADEWLYELLNILSGRAGVQGKRSTRPYRALVREQKSLGLGGKSNLPLGQALLDFYNMMQSWDDDKTGLFLRESRAASTDDGHDALQTFFEPQKLPSKRKQSLRSDENLDAFVEAVNKEQLPLPEVASRWLHRLCQTYTQYLWHTDLRDTIVEAAVTIDSTVYIQYFTLVDRQVTGQNMEPLTKFVQTLYEIHLDKLCALTAPGNTPDAPTLTDQKARVDRWGYLAREVMYNRLDNEASTPGHDQDRFLQTRHVWASILHLQATGEGSQQFLTACFNQLSKEHQEAGQARFELPNSTVMAEMSSTAAKAQISKLETMTFFRSIFQQEQKPPLDLIESLEPLLEVQIGAVSETDSDTEDLEPKSDGEDQSQPRSTVKALAKFLGRAKPSLRTLLWMRLRGAYQTIDYPPKLLSVELRCVQVIMQGLKSNEFRSKSQTERDSTLLDTLGDLREILDSSWNIVKDDNGSAQFDCFDLEHVQDSIEALLDLSLLLYAVCLFDDHSQIGGKGGPTINPFRSYPSDTFHMPSIKLHNMQVQTFVLLYRLFDEIITQVPEHFPAAEEDKLQFLKYVHYHFGMRRMCKALESSYLHFMKNQLMTKLPTVEQQSSNDLAQVLYDLYDLQCFSVASEKQDHGCDQDYLDQANAMQLVDFVLDKAKATTTKDLLKSDLGKAVEKLSSTLDRLVTRDIAARRNNKIYLAFLKSPILPVNLYRALKGIVDLPAIHVKQSDAIITSKGWFFLKGQLALARYRAQRARGNQGNEDDLHQANQHFLQDLEFDPERWETWYRMAQTYELLIEEEVMWSADPVNNDLEDVAALQRSAIHAYTLAVAMCVRVADVSVETRGKLAELYTDFAVCLYSATREPFAMAAFPFDNIPVKHYWDEETGDSYDGIMYHHLSKGEAWKLCVVLLRQAAALKPDSWMIPYMLAKCCWKLHQKSDGRKSSLEAVQKSLSRAVVLLPRRRDPVRQDPLLEPIYKVIAITHKLVSKRKELDPATGSAFIDKHLDVQKQFDASKRPQLSEATSWDAYILDMLKMLRAADKSRWHHRPVIRAAKLMETLADSATEGASAAKDYLADQHIYSTKTMTLNVWKPEHERPGRHHVYNTRYCLYLNELVERTSDMEGIQMLVKRVRKKTGEFYKHIELWTQVVATHLKLHERHIHVEQGCAEVVFRDVDQDQFKTMSGKIDAWIRTPDNERQAPYCDALTQLVELKRLNGNLIKSNAIDDLVADTYAEVWRHAAHETEAPSSGTAPATPHPTEKEPEVQTSNLSTPPQETKPNKMSFQSLLNMDGTLDSRSLPTRPATPPPAPAFPVIAGLPDQRSEGFATPTKSRARLISRRELLKRATDAVLVRPAARPASPVKQAAAPTNPNIKVVIDTDMNTTSAAPSSPVEEGDNATVPSAPPSVHDDADDESELSSVPEHDDEDTPPKRIFPGLIRKTSNIIMSSKASDADEDDDDDDTLTNTQKAATPIGEDKVPSTVAETEDHMDVDMK